MKLLNLTTRRILLLIFSALALWSSYFYFSLQSEINENMDEYLQNRKFEILRHLKQNRHIYENNIGPHTDFKIQKITIQDYKGAEDNFKDVDVFEGLEQENEPYRQLETYFQSNDGFYKLSIVASLMDKEELMATILKDVILLFLIIFILILFLKKAILQKLWNPFYLTLEKLKRYSLDKNQEVSFEESKISEFEELNLSLKSLMQKNYQVYQQQKQFIENASHEIQTPLAIASNKLELLIQKKDLGKEEAELIQSINVNLERLSSLNKNLLLLSKIENNQFSETEDVHIASLISDLYQEFQSFAAFKDIRINIYKDAEPIVSGNRVLLEILFRNLIKNALYHNLDSGYVSIFIGKNKVDIENTGPDLNGPPEILFNRFSKNSNRPDSLGLGLSIVKSIADLHNYSVNYFQEKQFHRITIQF